MSMSEQGVKNRRKAKKQVGKSLPVVVFTFREAGARFADRWRCRNQTYLDNADWTATKNHGCKKNSMQ
jgi:hypothetical protein